MDISVKMEGLKFNYRVGAIISYNGKYLVQKPEKDNFYSLVGGRVAIGDNSYTSMERELEEELGLKSEEYGMKIVNVTENFFKYGDTKFHEILFLFKVEMNQNSKLIDKTEIKILDKDAVSAYWLTEKEIKEINLQPAYVKESLTQNNLKHNIVDEIS